MKLVFLVATALMAAPAFAQDTTQTDAASTTAPAPAAPVTGGYQPAQPAISGPAQPGAPVVFKEAPSPQQAYPAPAPLQSYPICKKGQFDQCRQRGGK
ncbi:hypothetical protein RN629_13310 [Sphingomonadaceae bacterium jetA1]|jgi:hypothetical protein|uniref:hypothetical protein n=1 Tax=Facivitalis istanbulensis TaxID=3075838 RepID=UPI0034708602